jgi:hypothetical protein
MNYIVISSLILRLCVAIKENTQSSQGSERILHYNIVFYMNTMSKYTNKSKQ